MEADQKIYGVHWEVEKPYPLWQLTSQNYLRVDVTPQFESKFRIIAYRDFIDEAAEALRNNIEAGHIQAVTCGQGGFSGNHDDIFEYTQEPGVGYGWRVTNCAHILPAYRHRMTRDAKIGDAVSNSFTRHPRDGFVTQFNAVPWDIMKRYWRKPIHLDRKFHGRKRGKHYGIACTTLAIEVLDFDITLLKNWKCFFADFSFMWASRTRIHDVKIAMWMLHNVKGFSILTDEESPFNRADDELIFTLEHM